VKDRRPLPCGGCISVDCGGDARAYLPSEWPVRMAPEQMAICRPGSMDPIVIHSTYEVMGLTADTRISVLTNDLRSFLARSLGAHAATIPLHLVRRKAQANNQWTFEALDDSLRAGDPDVDLFNLASGAREGEDLVDRACAVTRSHSSAAATGVMSATIISGAINESAHGSCCRRRYRDGNGPDGIDAHYNLYLYHRNRVESQHAYLQ
jgi:hypothetical protein